MKVDLRKLYSKGNLEIDEKIDIPASIYKSTNIKNIENTAVKGNIIVNYENNIEIDLTVNGDFIIPCAISLEDVRVPFTSKTSEIINENELNDEFYLDLLEILWENIVLEIPIRVVKKGIEIKDLHGEGWEMYAEK